MKKITLIFGSPRKEGNSEIMAEQLIASRPVDVEVDRFHVSGMKLGGCIDCRKCWSKGKPCIIDDDMQKIHESLISADLILFVTPLYWYSWSAQIKPVLDRLLPFLSEDAGANLHGKKAALVASAGDDQESCFKGLIFSFRQSCSLLGMEIAAELVRTDLYEKGEISDKVDVMEEIRRQGRDLF